MYTSIVVPVDLAEPDLAKPAIATAVTLSNTFNAAVRFIHVMRMTPVMLAEYVPADFDSQQREASEQAMTELAAQSGLPTARVSSVVRQGGIYHEILEEAATCNARYGRRWSRGNRSASPGGARS